MINNGHIGHRCLRNLKRKANEATNNFSGTAAGIGGSVCVNYLCPVEAGGGGMTKDEALDLALKALESERPYLGPMPSKTVKAITAIKQVRALDKKAENARELGLDYEPVLKDNSNYRYDPPVAEPVVFYRCNGCGHAYEQFHPTSCDCMEAEGFDRVEYYTTPPNVTTPPKQPAPVQSCYCPNCEAMGKELAALKAQPASVQEPVTLRPEDVTVEVLTVQGGGGFAPLRTHGVKLTHKPTGIVVQCSSERSQHRNREQALRDLERYLHGARPQPTPPAAQPAPVQKCPHDWTDESRGNGWRSACRICGEEAAGSGQ